MKSQIVIAGIGGQGVLFAANIFIEIAKMRGLPILGSETHGMSQRGGSVTSCVKVGDYMSPMVGEGDADILLAFEPTEAHRNLSFLKAADGGPGAFCIVGVPRQGSFPDKVIEPELSRLGARIHTCLADQEAARLGNSRASNLILMGFSAKLPDFPFTYEEMAEATMSISAPGHRKANAEALLAGRELAVLSAI